MEYRKEIDGLRAIAVLPVILFHAGFKAFGGGFIGVDVFFVISGYLITTIILSDMNKGTFSIVTFYERRARRILPALFFVMLCCLPFAWLWMLPTYLKDFSQSLTAVSAFSSNIFFLRGSDYFGTASELKPLLHTWSLAVEEQYYLLFPLFLKALWKLRKRWIFGSLMVIGGVSLLAAQWGAYHSPARTFYLLPTRAWELAIGALIAFYFLYKREHAELIKSHIKTSEVFGFIGLLLICYSIFAFDKNTPFPSFYALIPTIGTGLIIIFSTSETLVGRFLGTKPMVGIGLLSYSTYLWHQPLFVFARHRSLSEPGTALLLVLSASSVLLAYISWRFVESPFRDKKVVSKKGVFIFAGFGSLLFALVGMTSSASIELVSREKTSGKQSERYHIAEAKHSVALWGDSFADAFAISLGEMLNKKGISLNLYIKHSCPSIIETIRNEDVRLGKDFSKRCSEYVDYSYRDILEKKPDFVVITSAYARYLNAKNHAGEPILLDSKSMDSKPADFMPEKMRKMIEEFSRNNIRTIIVTPHPTLDEDDFFTKQKKLKFGVNDNIYANSRDAKSARDIVMSKIDKEILLVDEVNGLTLLTVDSKSDECKVVDENGDYLLYDGKHVSTKLAHKIANIISGIIESHVQR